MPKITLDAHENIALLRFTNGVTNAISCELVDELSASLPTIVKDARGLVLAGGDKFFSIGLDLPQLLQLPRREMDSFWQRFDQVLLELYTLPIPAAAAINGHAVAGGTILALTADCRFIGDSRNLMGLNEVNIGVPVPYLADLMLRQLIDARAADEMVFGGELIAPEKAKAIGLVSDVVPEESLETRTVETVKTMALKPQHAMRQIMENRTEAVRQRFEHHRDVKRSAMMQCWFQPEVQQMLAEAAKKF
jgi:enoyl-CoA hydratase/carnithine racemase